MAERAKTTARKVKASGTTRRRRALLERAITETPLAATTITASGNSGQLAGSYGNARSCRAQLAVGAVTGTSPTLDVYIEDTLDGTNWNIIGKFAQLTASNQLSVINMLLEQGSTAVTNFSPLWAERWRLRWVIGGTATPTFNAATVTWIIR
jgi:hypothetical protein